MDRRNFIVTASGAALVLGAATLTPPGHRIWQRLAGTGLDTNLDARLGPGAHEVIKGLIGTDTVARTFIQSRSTPVDALSVERFLVQRLELGNDPNIGAEDFRNRLAAMIRADFRADRLCRSSEWVLSETECNVAAWRYLVYRQAGRAAATEWNEGEIVAVEDWGPRGTAKGTPFNVQSDGHSGLWFKAKGAPSWLKLEIGGRVVSTVVSEEVVTSGLYGDLQPAILGKPGEYHLVFIDEMNKLRQPIGVFTVEPAPIYRKLVDGSASKVFCELTAWGPQSSPVGIVANAQPDGSAGLWFKISCVPKTVVVMFDGAALRTTIDGSTVTARLPSGYFSAARHADISLYDPVSKEAVPAGKFIIGD